MVPSVTKSNHSSKSMESNLVWYDPLSWIIAIISFIGSLLSRSEKASLDPERVQDQTNNKQEQAGNDTQQLEQEIIKILTKEEELTNKEFNHGRDILNDKLRNSPQYKALNEKYYNKLLTRLQVKNTKIENEKRIKKKIQYEEIDSKFKEIVIA